MLMANIGPRIPPPQDFERDLPLHARPDGRVFARLRYEIRVP